jgi:ABC-type branched-subunit amino acid transport system permease subunit
MTVNAQNLLELLRWPSALLVVLLAYPAVLAWLGRRGLLRLPSDGRAAALVRPYTREFLGRHRSSAIFIAMLAVAALLPFIVTLPVLNEFQRQNVWLTGFSYAGVFVLLAIGLNIVVGLAGLLDLGYAAFFAIGSYAYAFGASPFSHNHFPFLLMIVVGAVVAATFGVLLGAPTLRLRGDYLAIVTLGFGEIVPIVFLNGGEFTEGTNGIGGIYKPDLPLLETFSILNPWPFYLVMAIMIAVVMILVYKLERSRLGRAWMAVREDELAAAANGINTVTTKLLAFSLGASTSGFAGVFNASYLQIVSPDQFSFTVSFTVLAMIVLGGMGNIWGVAMGAFILYNVQVVLLHQLNTFFDNFHLPHPNFIEYQFLLFGLAIVFMMLLRPEGLFPSQRRKRELHASEELEGAELPGADLSGADPSSAEVQL